MLYGYHGRILHVDLTIGKLEIETPGVDFYRKYMGGSALGLYYLLRNTHAGLEPLSPENVLVFALSVVTGAPVSGMSRMTVVAKSPLTEVVGDSQSGGFFPAGMKQAGFDAIVVKGRAHRPVYLWLDNGEAELRSAEHLWGKVTGEVEVLLQEELGDDKIEVLQCGPAGERFVRFAALISHSNRANGRTGMGAVMASKNLRAVAVRGRMKPEIADRKAVLTLAKWGAEHLAESDIAMMPQLGTSMSVAWMDSIGALPTRNWRSGTFVNAAAIDGSAMAETILQRNDTCYACAVRCKRVVAADERYHVDSHYGGPEYETIYAFGSSCAVDDLEAVAYANQLCNMYGMDTISCGMTIAWAMDCFEQGILTKEDTGGIELRFGNAEAMVQTTELIAKREGIGDLLAEGSARAAAKIGREAQDLLATVKQQELPGHMPQVKRSLALIYAVNSFGPDHQSHEHDPSYRAYPDRMQEIGLEDPPAGNALDENMVRFALHTQRFFSAMDTLSVCQFVFGPGFQLYGPNQLADTVSAVTGWNVDTEELLRVGERRLNMLRAFNAREGVGRESDQLPNKLYRPLIGGKTEGEHITVDEVEQAKDRYYAMAGWDIKTGVPTREKLEELGLGWITDQIDA